MDTEIQFSSQTIKHNDDVEICNESPQRSPTSSNVKRGSPLRTPRLAYVTPFRRRDATQDRFLMDSARSLKGIMNMEDEGTLEQLHLAQREYKIKAHVQECARNQSIYQSLVGSILWMMFLSVVSVSVLVFAADVTFVNALIFFLYTITTAGFGSVKIPHDSGFLMFVVFLMLIGIASLTVLVACTYQYIAMISSRVKISGDDAILARKGLGLLAAKDAKNENDNDDPTTLFDKAQVVLDSMGKNHATDSCFKRGQENFVWLIQQMKMVYRKNEIVRAFTVLLYLIVLLLLLTVPMMYLESWTFMEGLYFATFVMTTVGYGDIAPTTTNGTIYVIFFILFNISFVSIYMGNLARYYLMFSNSNFNRIKNKLLRKRTVQEELGEPSSKFEFAQGAERSVKSSVTFKDAVLFVCNNIHMIYYNDDTPKLSEREKLQMAKLLTMDSPWNNHFFKQSNARPPPFVVLILLQERIIYIITTEITCSDSACSVKGSTLSVTYDCIDKTITKWHIPTGAREAFALCVFELIVHVGENQLLTSGSDAVMKLSPFKVFDIFSPLLAMMVDAGTMEGWLAKTELLAQTYFPYSQIFLTE